ncbi:hypothetical protein PSPTOT1_2501 [Pseudomonas syringae pv. tomato T1]|nr:hypothetical protein PSPTOT1_2501 [Pseudomonas syringae pv. tomato T1]
MPVLRINPKERIFIVISDYILLGCGVFKIHKPLSRLGLFLGAAAWATFLKNALHACHFSVSNSERCLSLDCAASGDALNVRTVTMQTPILMH